LKPLIFWRQFNAHAQKGRRFANDDVGEELMGLAHVLADIQIPRALEADDAPAEWDAKYKNQVDHHEVIDGKFVPKNRPCDWCGKRVKLGYIHKTTCGREEAKTILDLIY
jgi:hypothetical protein